MKWKKVILFSIPALVIVFMIYWLGLLSGRIVDIENTAKRPEYIQFTHDVVELQTQIDELKSAVVAIEAWSVNKSVDSLVSDYINENVAPRIAEAAEQFAEDADDIVSNLDKSLLESMREQAEADGKTPEEIEKLLATAEEVLAEMKK